MSKKERTLDQYRQSKEYQEQIPQIGSEGEANQLEYYSEQVTGQNNPWDVHGNDVYRKSYQHDLKHQLIELRKKYPNDQAFGSAVAKLL